MEKEVREFIDTLEENLDALEVEGPENLLNREGDILPFGLFKPELEGKLAWMCSYGEDGTSIFCVFIMNENGKTEKEIREIKNLEEAKFYRDELLRDGWKILVPPKIVLTMKDKNGVAKPLNRQQKRELEKHVKNSIKDKKKE